LRAGGFEQRRRRGCARGFSATRPPDNVSVGGAKQKTTENERNARETAASFRRLALEEIQAARPLRIKVITVQPGDTVESLSHRMAGVDRPAERFRVLNGLEAHAQVKVRDRVKIVVD
jgi:predicted Zn-dependent protease